MTTFQGPEDVIEGYTREFCNLLKEQLEPVQDGEDGRRVGEVYLTRIFNTCNIPGPYYSAIRKVVFESEPPIAVLVRRGAGGRGSIVAWMRDPTAEDLAATRLHLTKPVDAATLRQDTERRVDILEAWRMSFASLNVIQAMKDHEDRIASLERQLARRDRDAS